MRRRRRCLLPHPHQLTARLALAECMIRLSLLALVLALALALVLALVLLARGLALVLVLLPVVRQLLTAGHHPRHHQPLREAEPKPPRPVRAYAQAMQHHAPPRALPGVRR